MTDENGCMSPNPERPWIIRPHVLGIIAIVCIAYALIADAAGLYILGMRDPHTSYVGYRLGECASIWVLGCIGWLGWMLARRRSISPASVLWPLVVVPIVAGALAAVFQANQIVTEYGDMPPTAANLLGSQRLLIPLLAGGLGGGILWLVALGSTRQRRPDLCYNCGRDLKGVISSRCPDCRLQRGEGGRARSPASVRAYPELLSFETAVSRDQAWLTSREKLLRTSAYRIANIVWFMTVGVLLFLTLSGIPTRPWWWLLVVGLILVLLVIQRVIGHRRRHVLRSILVESGIPVCLECGQDLRECTGKACPECGAALTRLTPASPTE